jgi:stage III sporulation protein AH
MVLKKQTVWLLTMLTLMVVLSAYYLFNHQTVNLEEYSELEQQNLMDALGEIDSDFNLAPSSDMDFFLSYKFERDTLRAQQLDQYSRMISSEVTAQKVAEVKGKLDEIHELAEAELTLESLLKSEGFEEAVVIADLDRVNVVVRSDSLERQQVLNIIHLVRNHFDVAGNQVVVDFR